MIRLAIALFLCGWPALASPQCAPRDDVAKMLSEKYGEIPSRIGMAADGTRGINLPLFSFINTTTPAVIDFTSGVDASPDFTLIGATAWSIIFDDTLATEDTESVSTTFSVPDDFASTGTVTIKIRSSKDAQTGGSTEVLNCALSVNGGAEQAAGTVTPAGATTADHLCSPTYAAPAAGDAVTVRIWATGGPTINDQVRIEGVRVVYTSVAP